MKVLDIAPHRAKRRQFSEKFEAEGHVVVTVPGRREALEMIGEHDFDLMVLDASSDLYDTKALVQEMRDSAENEPVIAVLVEPRNRPPRHRIAGRASNVIVLQDGSVDHMARMVHLAISVREGEDEDGGEEE